MEDPLNALGSPSARENCSRRDSLEKECERRRSYQSSSHLGKQAQPIDLQPIERSEIFLKNFGHLWTYLQKKRARWRCSNITFYPPNTLRTGSHVPVLQPWQIRATSMLSWEAGRKGRSSSSYLCLYLPLAAAFLRIYQISFLWIQQQFGCKICCYLVFTNGYLCWYQRVSLLDLHGFSYSADLLRCLEWDLQS